jgi:hypothetical protein
VERSSFELAAEGEMGRCRHGMINETGIAESVKS